MGIQNSFPGPTGVTDATEARKGLAGLVVRDTSGNARAGIFPRHTNALVTARSDMNVDVAAFEGISVRGGGPLWMANDGTTQVAIATAPGSNQRLDVVYYKQDENAAPYADGDTNAVLTSQPGPVTASPTLAATLALLPVGAVPVASVLVPAGKTATNQSGVVITQIFAYAALTGEQIWVRTASDLAVTSGYNAMNGYAVDQRAFAMDTGIEYRWNGAAWKPWNSPVIARTGTILQNVTVGNGSLVAYYQFVNGKVKESGDFTFGSTSSVTGNVRLTPAVAMDTGHYGSHFVRVAGTASIEDAGTAVYPIDCWSPTVSTYITFVTIDASGALAKAGLEVNASNPQPSWSSSPADTLHYELEYFPA